MADGRPRRHRLAHLRAQAEAGAQALQVFDSWVGALGPDAYERCGVPAHATVVRRLEETRGPRRSTSAWGPASCWALMRRAGGDVIGVDWRTPLDIAWDASGRTGGLQGNLDPAVLSAPWDVVEAETDLVLSRRRFARRTHLQPGHGVPPTTDPDTLRRLVDLVHERTERPEAPVSDAPVGVLVMAYGTASGPDDIERYYTDIRGGATARTGAPRRAAGSIVRSATCSRS